MESQIATNSSPVIATKWAAIREDTGNNNLYNISRAYREIQNHHVHEPSQADYIVRVKDGGKAYGSNMVLNGYGLLGASGCGKTTLLSCIVGTRILDAGEIFFCGESMDSIVKSGGLRNRVGYMPQELALYKEFTIKEALLFFGRIFGLTSYLIIERTNFLLKFLQLPSQNSFIRQLSGGQQRRASFAIALLHQPQLLILDEPTVGMDPILRRSIWEHLRNLVNAGKTSVIITTHYIEEAQNADTVGMMRSGRILTEGEPTALLEKHHCPNLEDLFLTLSLIDESVGSQVPQKKTSTGKATKTKKSSILTKVANMFRPECNVPNCWSAYGRKSYINRLRALTWKNTLHTYRQPAQVFSFIILPAMQVLLCCWSYAGQVRGLNFGVINHEVMTSTPGQEHISCASYLKNRTCDKTLLSCDFVNALEKVPTFNIIQLSTYEEGVKDIKAGKIWGFLTIPSNFTRLTVEKSLAGLYADNETIIDSRIQIDMDMTNHITSREIQGRLFQTIQSLMKNMVKECEPNFVPEVLDGPLWFNKPIYGKLNEVNYVTFAFSGLLLLVMYFASMTSTGTNYVVEKKQGMLERTIIAGVSTTEIITAQLLTHMIIMMVQTVLCLLVVFGIFKIPINGQLGFAVLLVLLQGILGLLAGITLSSIFDEESVVMQVSIAVCLPTVVFGGVFWPVSNMPIAAQYFASIFIPQTIPNESFRSMLVRNWGITHPVVWPGFVITIVWLIGLWFVATIFAKRGVVPSNR